MKAYICNIAPAMKQQEFFFTLTEIDAIAEQLLKQFHQNVFFILKEHLVPAKRLLLKPCASVWE
jgi:hypothetical protein